MQLKLNIGYTIKKPFTRTYSAFIAVAFLMCLVAIVFWAVLSKKDCLASSSPDYNHLYCQPFTITNGDVMLQASSLGAFAYGATIMNLQHDYQYKNTTFNCGSTYDYRFVLNADNSTDIYYVASCYFLDGKNTTFNLEVNTVVPNITYGWDADLQTASCLAPNTSCLLESLVFYDGDTDPDKVVMVGLNVDPKGNISAYINQNGDLDSDYGEPSTIPLLEYFQKKRSDTIDFTYAEKNVFQTAYSCLDCSTTSAWKIALGLLTVLSSLGATAYSILISIAEKLHTEQPDTTTVTTTITEKKLHQAISAITNLDDMI